MSDHHQPAFWLEKLAPETFPILRRSREVLAVMERDMDTITDDAIAKQIYHDPFLMANLLRRVAKMPRRGLAGEVTTIGHAVMMLGLQPFFRWAKGLPVIEDMLRSKAPVLQHLMTVLSCSYHAAHQAWQWSLLRRDINADEVFVATIMQNSLAWSGWLLMSGEIQRVEQIMRRDHTDFASAFSQHTDLLFNDMQTQLARKWGLPDLYTDFLHGHNALRGQGVVLAVKLAEATQRGWWQPQVEEIIAQIAEWLHQPADELTSKIHAYSAQAARQTEGWYGNVTPAAAWLPMLPGEWPDEAPVPAVSLSRDATPARNNDAAPVSANMVQAASPPAVKPGAETAKDNHVMHPEVVARIVADIKSHMDGSFDIGQLMSRVLAAMHDGLAFDRVVFALLSTDQTVKARFTLGVEDGAPMKNMNFSLLEKHMFAQLMNKMQAVWFHESTQQKLAPFLLPKLRAQIGRGEFMAMSVFIHDKPVGFFYADYGDRGRMDENVYNGFKQLCALTAEGMAHLSKKPKS